jgi:hypothetical protein
VIKAQSLRADFEKTVARLDFPPVKKSGVGSEPQGSPPPRLRGEGPGVRGVLEVAQGSAVGNAPLPLTRLRAWPILSTLFRGKDG